MSEDSSDVQVLDSGEPLVTASSSVPSSSSVRVMDSIDPLVATARVQVLDSNVPPVLPCVLPVLDEPVAGPSGVAAGSTQDEDEDIVTAIPWSSGRRISPYSNELR